MANIKSQIKRNRQTEKRRVRNLGVRTEMRTRIKNALAAAESGDDNAEQTFRDASKAIDKAANKGIIHKNQADRRKSRLAKAMARSAAS